MALGSRNTDPAAQILALVEEQYNSTIEIRLDDAEYGPWDPVTDERTLIKPATILISPRAARTKLVNQPTRAGNSYTVDTKWKIQTQYTIAPTDPTIPKGAILDIKTHTRDPQLVGQTAQVVGSSVSSLIDVRKVFAEGEIIGGNGVG